MKESISPSTLNTLKKSIVTILILLGIVFSAACASQPETSSDNKVITSTYPVFYLASRVADQGMEVELLMPPSADPHNWEPSPKQIAQLENCRLFIYNGAGLESWAPKVTEMAAGRDTKVLELATVISDKLLPHTESKDVSRSNHEAKRESEADVAEEAGHNHGEHDPHFWLDPVLALEMAKSIMEALTAVDPGNKALYQHNFSLLSQDLEKIHHTYETTLARCSKKQFVVSHEAFGYLAKRYGLEQIPIMGVSAESEPTPSRLAELSDLLRSLDICYVFTEPFTGDRVAQVLASETGAEILELNPIGGLTQEDLDAGADYLSLMENNLEQLKVALDYE
jgi:zinc transport system substrate-binding protein